MAITTTALLVRVKQITGRTNLTSLGASDIYVLDCMIEMAKVTRSLKNTAAGTLAAAQSTITKPTDMIGDIIDEFIISSIPVDPFTFFDYQQDGRAGYVLYGSSIYFRPSAIGGEAYTIYYPRTANAADILVIPFGDDYKLAMEYYCAARVYEDYELFGERDKMMEMYNREMIKLIPVTPVVVRPQAYSGVRL